MRGHSDLRKATGSLQHSQIITPIELLPLNQLNGRTQKDLGVLRKTAEEVSLADAAPQGSVGQKLLGGSGEQRFLSGSSISFVWLYYGGLFGWLSLFSLYLLLPRGIRKRYCRSPRKRYSRLSPDEKERRKQEQKDQKIHSRADYLPQQHRNGPQRRVAQKPSMEDSVLQGVENKKQEQESKRQQLLQAYMEARENTQQSAVAPSLKAPSFQEPGIEVSNSSSRKSSPSSSRYQTPPRTPGSSQYGGSNSSPRILHGDSPVNEPARMLSASQRLPNASFEHPAIPIVPSDKILDEALKRLQTRGIRLNAHGVHCTPKRVWIRLDEVLPDDGSEPSGNGALEWRTEVPREITNQLGEVSTVLMRGTPHRIALPNILFVDVGKKTSALAKATTANPHHCLSLLTQTGSLDLQTRSQLERDALVSCLCYVLDLVHPQHDWRRLYEQSPASSSVFTASQPGAVSSSDATTDEVSNISSTAFEQPVRHPAEI